MINLAAINITFGTFAIYFSSRFAAAFSYAAATGGLVENKHILEGRRFALASKRESRGHFAGPGARRKRRAREEEKIREKYVGAKNAYERAASAVPEDEYFFNVPADSIARSGLWKEKGSRIRRAEGGAGGGPAGL